MPNPAHPRTYVSSQELLALKSREPWKILRDGVAIWVVILGSFYAWAATSNYAVLAVAFVLIAGRQHALNNMVHEASHYLFSKRPLLNDWICDAFFAAPHLISTAGYRAKHMEHHSHLGHPERDTEFKARYIIRGARFWYRSVTALLGVAAFATAGTYGKRSQSLPGRGRLPAFVGVTNAALFGYLWALGIPLAWIYLWFLPLITLTSYLAMLRVLAEHQSDEYTLAGREDFEHQLDPAITRTIPAGPIARFLLAPVNFHYHLEHHAFPGVPYTSLPRLHRLLVERGYYRDHPELLGVGYLEVLRRRVFPQSRTTSITLKKAA